MFVLAWTIGLLKKLHLITTPFIPVRAGIPPSEDWNRAAHRRNSI